MKMDTLRSEGVFLLQKTVAPTLDKMHPLLLKEGARFLTEVGLKIVPKSRRVHFGYFKWNVTVEIP